MRGGERFDTGQDLLWLPSGTVNLSQGVGAIAGGLYSFDPTDGPQLLRVDYLSVTIEFGFADVVADAIVYMKIGVGGTPVPLLAAGASIGTTGETLIQAGQLTLPFVITDYCAFTLQGHTSGASTSVIGATISTSIAYRPPGLPL